MSALLDFLQRNKENKRVMAALRSALVDNLEMRAWPVLLHFYPKNDEHSSQVIRTVAGLYARHPLNCDSGNMGTVCRQLCSKDEKPWDIGAKNKPMPDPGSMGRRFMYLLSSEPSEICTRVCRLVSYAASKNIPINYAALEKDLKYWPHAKEAWGREFWAAPKDAADEEGESA